MEGVKEGRKALLRKEEREDRSQGHSRSRVGSRTPTSSCPLLRMMARDGMEGSVGNWVAVNNVIAATITITAAPPPTPNHTITTCRPQYELEEALPLEQRLHRGARRNDRAT